MQQILDPCCGGKMFYFEKDSNLVLFGDKRFEEYSIPPTSDRSPYFRKISVKPDLILDVCHLPFEDSSFKMVVLDPPHFRKAGQGSYMAKKYGLLPNDWRSFIHDAFSECFRVLDNDFGVLIFKWNEYQISLDDILKLTEYKPLFGNKQGKQMKTHWLVFVKSSSYLER